MNILIAEDEPRTARRLQRLVAEIIDRPVSFTVVDSVVDAVAALNEINPDLILLDINLADGSSLDIFTLTKVSAPVIFTTAHDEHALRAFRLNAVDYLLKPINKQDLSEALGRWRSNQLVNPDLTRLVRELTASTALKRFLIRVGQQLHLVDTAEIAYFYTEDRIVFLKTFADRRFPVDQSLDAIEEGLDAGLFFRINRQMIINREAIAEMHAYSKARVVLTLQPAYTDKAVVSTERSPVFKEWLVG